MRIAAALSAILDKRRTTPSNDGSTAMTPAEFKRKWPRYTGKESSAYGWPADLTDEQILERLLALNLERAEEEAKAAKGKKPKATREKSGEEML
jgi:hypothetical protein